jgi:hypothetical protein
MRRSADCLGDGVDDADGQGGEVDDAGERRLDPGRVRRRNDRNDDDVASIMASQELNFLASRTKLEREIGLLTQNVKALEFRANGYQHEFESMGRQLAFLQEEYEGKKILQEKGLLRKTEIKAIQRAMADAEGQMGKLTAEVSETGAQIDKHHQQIEQTVAALEAAFTHVGPWEAFTGESEAHQAMQEFLGEGNLPGNDGFTFGWIWSYPMKSLLEQAAAPRLLESRHTIDDVLLDGELPLPELAAQVRAHIADSPS